MKWKAQNKKVSKVASNPAKYPGEQLHIDASGPHSLPMGRKEYWLNLGLFNVRKNINNHYIKKTTTMNENKWNTCKNC
jgi:hypothetical protein